MLLRLVGAVLVIFLLAEPLDGIMLMGFVVVVITISIYQEHPLRSNGFRSTGVGIRPSFGAAPSADQTTNHGPCNCAGRFSHTRWARIHKPRRLTALILITCFTSASEA